MGSASLLSDGSCLGLSIRFAGSIVLMNRPFFSIFRASLREVARNHPNHGYPFCGETLLVLAEKYITQMKLQIRYFQNIRKEKGT